MKLTCVLLSSRSSKVIGFAASRDNNAVSENDASNDVGEIIIARFPIGPHTRWPIHK
jgi:hypothetical protein